MPKIIKRKINGASPKEIADILMVYKEGIEIPLHNFFNVMKEIERDKYHFFAVAVRNDKVYIEHNETRP